MDRGLYGPDSLFHINDMANKNRDEYFKAYYQANKERYAERSKSWREANPERANELSRKSKAKNYGKIVSYREKTREKRNAWQREYDKKRPEKMRAHNRKWREKNGKDYHSQWRAKNEGKVAFYTARRRSRKRYATPSWLTDSDWQKIDAIYAEAAKSGMDVDHIIPIQGKLVCGLHVPWNLQLLTPTENKMKSSRLPPDHDCIAIPAQA